MDSDNNEKKFKSMSRRELLKLSPLLLMSVFAFETTSDPILLKGQQLNDWLSSQFFRRNQLAPTFANSKLTQLRRFPINSINADDPGIDLERWRLKVEGNVEKPGEFTMEQIKKLPKVTQNTRHVCVEGWDVIGRFGGARLSDFLKMIGADTNSRYLYFDCYDEYYESLDMDTALHPQSLLCYEMYDQPIPRVHGAPLRLILPTKIGYKSAKYLTTIKVTNILERTSLFEDKGKGLGYWGNKGYSWYYGL
ncbi:MAG: molybdopterin-dependent oxidoreductase [Thermodesulfobacteriota bacterium]